MTPEETVSVIKELRPKRESHYGLKIPNEAIEAAVQLSNRYVTDKLLPGKAIQLLDEAASSAKGGFWGFKNKKSLTNQDISSIIAKKYKTEVNDFNMDKIKKPKTVSDMIKANLIGQDHIVDAVLQTIQAARAGFGDPKKPDGVFYFVGPSGVGKTEFAKQLAKVLYGSEDKLKRIDMSEFMSEYEVTRLTGAPPGLVGYDEGGVLTEWVKKNPRSVILLDEFEKAHPKVFDIFLQIFDAGRLTDGKGATADFSNVNILMTSNLGSEHFSLGAKDSEKFVGFKTEKTQSALDGDEIPDEILSKVIGELKGLFRIEFLNRIDEILVFKPLQPKHLKKIIPLILKKSPVKFQLSDKAMDFLANHNYAPQFGARHLERTLREFVMIPTSQMMVSHQIRKGDKVFVDIDGRNNEICINKM
jgi:ATP-dependent Clp protease ATP-binding subunit ClpC